MTKIEIYQSSVLGVVWGIFEITLGNGLHIAKVPLRGLLLSFIASVFLITGKNILPYKGSLIILGIICASVKTASSGAFLINPVIAIIMESFFAELVFSLFVNRKLSSILAGAAVLLYTFIHSLAAQLFFMGMSIIDFYNKTFSFLTGNYLGDNYNAAYYILSAYLLLHLLLGIISGFIGFRISERTQHFLSEYQNEARH